MTTRIGETIILKGHLSAAEDVQIAGRIEGDIHVQEHVVTIQPTADLAAGVSAKSIIIEGALRGDIVAGQSVALQKTASVAGTISAPRVAICDGADFNGRLNTTVPIA
jgi:cytoskeletal protein CcmA (bactofilin family)